jgi:uncharacterized protein (TIGR02611 family)
VPRAARQLCGKVAWYGPMRIAKTVGGFVLLAAGVVMLVLPGPGWVTIFAGLALLATEFEWAQRLLDRLKAAVHRVRRGSRQ